MFAKSAPIATRLVHNRNRSHVPGLDDNVHGTVGALFLAHHTALVLGPGKAKILFESGYAHPGPSLLGKRQGQYGVCRADSTAAHTLWQTGPTPWVMDRGKEPSHACLQPGRLQRMAGAGLHAKASTQAARKNVRLRKRTRGEHGNGRRSCEINTLHKAKASARSKGQAKGPARRTGGAACTPFEKPGLRGIPQCPVLAGLYTGKAGRHSQAMARLPDMPGASRPAGQAKAHCPHPVHVRSLTILNGTRRAKSARSAPAGHRYLHQKRGRTHSRTARTSQKTSTKEAVLKEPCSICR